MWDAFLGWIGVWWATIGLGAELLALASVPSVLVNRRGNPLAALSWILALVGMPIVGVTLWWLIGRRRLERHKRRRQRAIAAIVPRLESIKSCIESPSSRRVLLPFDRLPEELAATVFPPTSDNAVELLAADEAFEVMERDIERAEHHVHALFYIWKNDRTGRRFRDLLIKKARQGVKVRVLCDGIGSPVMATSFSRRLRRAGAGVARFLPPSLFSLPRMHFRNHRKVLIVDGRVGIIGGFNIADEYRLRWRDMGLRIRGPAVDQLQEVFADDWYYATNEDLADRRYFGCWARGFEPIGTERDPLLADVAVVASGPDTRHNLIHEALFHAINQTRERLWITTPYFIPSRPILAALRSAAFRGVDVRLMLPGNASDVPIVRYASRSYYPELLAVGVRILEYQPSMIHSKTLVLDRDLALIGSANLDSRSFGLNFEASCFVAGSAFNANLAEVFERDSGHCREVTLPELEGRPWTEGVIDAAANLLSPLL